METITNNWIFQNVMPWIGIWFTAWFTAMILFIFIYGIYVTLRKGFKNLEEFRDEVFDVFVFLVFLISISIPYFLATFLVKFAVGLPVIGIKRLIRLIRTKRASS